MGALGCLGGACLGLGGYVFMLKLGIPLDPSVYYIDRVPVHLTAFEVITVLLGALSVSMLASLLPSSLAARLRPADALRYE